MMKPTPTLKIAYQLFGQTVLLILLYLVVALMTAVKFLPTDPFAQSLGYIQASGFAHVLLNLAIVTGLLGCGVTITADAHAERNFADVGLLQRAFQLWTVLLILTFFAGLFGLLEGRHLLELPFVLDILQLIGMSFFAWLIVRNTHSWTPFAVVYSVGLGLSIVLTLIGIIPTDNYLLDRVLRVLAVNVNQNVAQVVMIVAIGFWLMQRFGNVLVEWANDGTYIVAGLVAFAGGWVSLAPLYTISASGSLALLGIIIVPTAYAIFASHSYRALSVRSEWKTLSAHWYVLGLLLLMLSISLIGTLTALPAVNQWVQGTRITDLQWTMTAFGLLAIILGVINQTGAELRGINVRITGLMPFWLVTFGFLGASLALGASGIVQVYLERILTTGYLDVQRMLVPLYLLWILGWFSVALGMGIYALGFRARRPEITEN